MDGGPPAPTAAQRGARTWRESIPGRGDPRWPFAALLTTYLVLGAATFGFSRSPVQMFAVVASACVLDVALARALHGARVFPLSAFITGCSLAILLNYAHASPLLFAPVLLAIGSKHVLTWNGRHVYNPSLFGVVASLLLGGELITAAPAYQWSGDTAVVSVVVVGLALSTYLFRVGRGWLVVSFVAFYALQTALRAWIMRHHLPPEMLFVGTMTTPPFFLFAFYMITDPATSPKSPRAQVVVALLLALVDLALHAKESVFTLFYAAAIVATGRLVLTIARDLRARGARAVVVDELSPARLRAAVAVGAFAAIYVGAVLASGAPGAARDPGFRTARVDVVAAGLGTSMSRVLDEVDPRLHHVAKWVLSVGDAVAAGDYDGDGDVDLFLSNMLKAPGDRAALYRNDGDMRFARVPLPALAPVVADHRAHGLVAGGAFADVDGDGDQDLLLPVMFGSSRLLVNQLVETGAPAFVDGTAAAGLLEHTISLCIAPFDFDRDGDLDLYVANAVPPVLPGYDAATPLSPFALPQPAYEGDRRMFAFMHDGWHDAANGGKNVLWENRGDGTFTKRDVDAMGMPDTRWSLAVATVDFDHDGWTDLYVANDFGPDDVYMNRGGRSFARVPGRLFGDVGKDTYKGMNASAADFDRNGYLDVYVSNVHHALQAEGSMLWMVRPSASGVSFADEAQRRGALNERRFAWGAAAGDLDLDGWVDLVQANGMLDDRLDPLLPDGANKDYWYVNHKLMQSGPEIHTYADMWGDIRGRTLYPNEARRALRNRGDGVFEDVAPFLGLADPDNSRGVLLSDLDDDGDLDVLVTNQHGPVSLYRSDLRQTRDVHFVAVKLRGTTSNRDGIGARVVVTHGAVVQVDEAQVMGGFSAQKDARLRFGLAAYAGDVDVVVHWPSGVVQRARLAADRVHVVVEPGKEAP